jgi:hypothetical protein
MKRVHVSTIKLFNDELCDPVAEASKDKKQYIVEQILETIPPKTGHAAKNYRFEVKWLGYDDIEDITIEPYANLKRNVIFHNLEITTFNLLLSPSSSTHTSQHAAGGRAYVRVLCWLLSFQ